MSILVRATLLPIDRPSRRSRRTRRDLVAAARALLAEHGVTSLTVDAVTERADVAHGTFYHHFSSTEAVIAAAIEESMRELVESLQREFQDAPDKVWVLVATFSKLFRMLAAHPALGWMLERPHLFAAALREACDPFARRDVGAMVRAGDIGTDGVDRATRYWEWIVVGALVDWSARPRNFRRIERGVAEIFLSMLGVGEARMGAVIKRVQAGASPVRNLKKAARRAAMLQRGDGKE